MQSPNLMTPSISTILTELFYIRHDVIERTKGSNAIIQAVSRILFEKEKYSNANFPSFSEACLIE